jgi:hypothetical protein
MLPLTLGGMDDQIVAIVIMGGGMSVAVIAILTGAVRAVLVSKHREESRREIAAYVAEGSMTPQDAAMLLAAGGRAEKGCGWDKRA